MLNDQFHVNGIKSESMHAKRKGKTVVECNDYSTYTMANMPIIPDWKISIAKGEFNGLQAYYDLGIGWAALRRGACGCGPCKEQLK